MYINNIPLNLTQKEIAAALQIWNRAAISLYDIRHNLISGEDAISGYRLPASAFLYTGGGKAEVLLNKTAYQVERFGLFHCGKGTELTILPQCEWLEYYMVFYKAGEPAFHRREYTKMLEQSNPFRQQYGFAPENPVFLWELLRQMFESWKQPTPLDHFYEKASFYQLVYEVYKELQSGRINVLQPDVVEMAKRYLNEHYSKAIAIQDICDMLGVSYSHFHRSFKKQTGAGPQEYLINLRITQAKRLLKSGDALIPDIGEYCGFQDERNFRRAFMKNTGMTPNAYREELPPNVQDYALGNLASFSYNCESLVSMDKLKGKGATYMLKQTSGKAVAAATLSLMLLMSACGTAPANTDGADSTPTPAATSQVAETETRTVSTVMGDLVVPMHPQRVIITYGVGDVIALGIMPIATYDSTGTAYEKEVAQLPVWSEFEAEEILTYDPDLIIVANQEQYDEVSKVAPTVFLPFTELSMKERLTFLGEVLNKEDEAAEALSNFFGKIENAKKELESAGIGSQTFSLFENDADGSIWVYGDKWGRGGDLIYSQLGLKAPTVIQNEIIAKEQYRKISLEVMSDYAGDYILFCGELGELENNAVWNALPAVKNGNIIPIDFDLFYNIDIYSSEVQLDYIMSQLIKN